MCLVGAPIWWGPWCSCTICTIVNPALLGSSLGSSLELSLGSSLGSSLGWKKVALTLKLNLLLLLNRSWLCISLQKFVKFHTVVTLNTALPLLGFFHGRFFEAVWGFRVF